MKCYLKEVDNDAMLLCNSIHFRLKTLFGTSRTDALKLHPITNTAPIFAMKTMIIFMGVYPTTHTQCHSQHLLTLLFSFSSFLNHLRILCKKSARVGHLFRRGNLGSEHGLFLAAILQDFLDLKSNASAEIFFMVLHVVWGPCIPHYPIPVINHGKCLLIIHSTFQCYFTQVLMHKRTK